MPEYPRVSLATGYTVDDTWPDRAACGDWDEMPGVAIDSAGRVWTFNRGDVPLQVFSADGQYLFSWDQERFAMPHFLHVDHEDCVWLTDCGRHLVRKYSQDGERVLTLGTEGVAGEDASHFNQPTDVAVSRTGEAFVADGYGNNRIVHFDSKGRFVKAWGRLGSGSGEMSLPHAIAIDSVGRLYVGERNNARITVFDQDGNVLDEWRDVIVPWGICIAENDAIYVCGSAPMRWCDEPDFGVPPKDQIVLRFSPDGRVEQLATFPRASEYPSEAGTLNFVHGIAVDGNGNLYLTEIEGRRIQRFLRETPDDEGVELKRRR